MAASSATDMRRKFAGLALLVQETLKRDPHCGHVFVFRGKRGGLIEGAAGTTARGCACSPSAWSVVASYGHGPKSRAVTTHGGATSYLLEGIDWRGGHATTELATGAGG